MTVEEAQAVLDSTRSRWCVIHLDWPRKINERQAEQARRELARADHDLRPVVAVYPDGLRLEGSDNPPRWRKPIISLAGVLEVLARHGVKGGRGYYLPTGWGCTCDPFGNEFCEPGSSWACQPQVDPPAPAWFTWGEEAA